MAKRRSSYETYLSWAEHYGVKKQDLLKEDQYYDVKKLRTQELKETGKSTTNIAKRIASETAFTYDYRTGRAIRKAYKEMGLGDISVREARNIMQYDDRQKALREEVNVDFWTRVSEIYQQLRDDGISSRLAKNILAETIFGSP